MSELNPKLTQSGLQLYPQPMLPGFKIQLTHVGIGTGLYDPTGAETALVNEVARFPILPNLTNAPSPTQIQVGVNISGLDPNGHSPDEKWIGEIGFFSGNTLFAVWSRSTKALFYKSAEISVPFSYTLDLSILPANSVVVSVSPDVPGMQSLLFAHESGANPHPQYFKARGEILAGGAAGQVLSKASAAGGDWIWSDPASLLVAGSTIPSVKGQDVIYVKGIGWLEWVEVTGVGAYSGYRSQRCGAIEFGTTTAPRPYEADLVGGLGSKTTQASIWAWAQQQGHTVAAASWTTKVFKFADVDANTFRFPDLRDIFPRFTGTDADTGSARVLGSTKNDTLKDHIHGLTFSNGGVGGADVVPYGAAGTQANGLRAVTGVATAGVAGAETAPKHTAFAPRIHI